MTRVGVVTDSTSYLPPGTARAHGVTVVPLHVVIGNRTGSELDVLPSEVAAALHERRVQVTTSRPTPAELAAAYRSCDARQVVSIHLSDDLSGTMAAVDTALQKAEQVASWLHGHASARAPVVVDAPDQADVPPIEDPPLPPIDA